MGKKRRKKQRAVSEIGHAPVDVDGMPRIYVPVRQTLVAPLTRLQSELFVSGIQGDMARGLELFLCGYAEDELSVMRKGLEDILAYMLTLKVWN